jgi:RNA polymerase sigma factor (sigma-70 family)
MKIISENSTAKWNEPEAIRRAQTGDSAAFEWLYNAHSKRVYSVFLRILGNTGEAADLTQQVFLRLFRNIGMFRREPAVSAWLHRVTVNTALTFVRRKRSTEAANDNSDGGDAVLSFASKSNQNDNNVYAAGRQF